MLTPDNILREWINETCAILGCSEHAPRIRFEWNSRFTRRLGDASPHLMRVRFSIPLWDRIDDVKRKNTVVHEVCHLLAPTLYGGRVNSHGRTWRNAMIKCGQEPTRCHNADRTGIARTMPRVATARCKCMTHKLTKILSNKMLRGRKYFCCKCHTPLVLVTEAISAENPAV